MTVALNTPAVLSYVGNDTADVFPITFPTFEEENIEVEVEDSAGDIEELDLSTHFTLANIGRPGVNGSVTLVDTGDDWLTGSGKLKTGYTLYVKFAANPSQPMKGRDWGAFAPERFERTLDRLCMNIIAVNSLAQDLSPRVETSEEDIEGLETDVSALQLTVSDHETRIDSAETSISDHESRLDSAETSISDHEGRITALENSGFAPFEVVLQSSNFTAAYNKIYVITGPRNIQLPAPVADGQIRLKLMGADDCTILRNGSEKIDGVVANKILTSTKEAVTLVTDGTDWFFI